METPPVVSSGPCSECVGEGLGVQDGPIDFTEPMEDTPSGSGGGYLRSPPMENEVPLPVRVCGAGELLLSLLGVNQARNRRAEVIRVAGCAVIGQ